MGLGRWFPIPPKARTAWGSEGQFGAGSLPDLFQEFLTKPGLFIQIQGMPLDILPKERMKLSDWGHR